MRLLLNIGDTCLLFPQDYDINKIVAFIADAKCVEPEEIGYRPTGRYLDAKKSKISLEFVNNDADVPTPKKTPKPVSEMTEAEANEKAAEIEVAEAFQ